MKKLGLVITLAIILCIVSCSPEVKMTSTKGYYYGENKEIFLFPCYYFLTINDSTAYIEAYMNFKDIIMTNTLIGDHIKSRFPYTTKLDISKGNKQVFMTDSLGNQLIGKFRENKFYLKKPKHITFNKLDSFSNILDCKRNLTLYHLAFHYPNMILNVKDTLKKEMRNYISHKVGWSKFLYQKCFEINYIEYKAILSDSVNNYYMNYKP